MSRTTQTLMGTFGMTDYLMPMVLEDLSDEDARRRARGDEGPSIAWTVGHLLHYRLHVMGLLGRPAQENPYAERFGKADATGGSDYPTVSELREQWDSVAQDLRALLDATSDEDFDKHGEGPHAERSLRDQVTFFAWHEGYHMGAIGAQLKALGYLGPAEKVMAARSKGG
jgi:uncharacterized damage-inducible protein DinB